MKFAPGGSLLDASVALRHDPRRIVALMAKVARAVQYAHGQGILHRDLKPGNVMLDARGEPLVSDFGLAKWLDTTSDLTRTLTIFGTPGYIAPEQARGHSAELKPAADVYSLGAILFDLFTGRPPFMGAHALAVIQQAAEKSAPKLRTLVPTLDRDLETICARCLEREPQTRYQSAGDLAEDLERWLDGRPVLARPVLRPVRIWRWARRNPKLAASVAGSAFGAVGVAILATFVFYQGASRSISRPVISEKSIAVLPFENLRGDKENAYFTEGIQDEILRDLSKVADLKVISRTSVMQYPSNLKRNVRQIAAELGVARIVEGTVQRSGGHVKISAQLIDALNDKQIWGDTIDRPIADVFAVQSEVAVNIVAQLRAKLSSLEEAAIKTKPTNDLMAYDKFVRARNLIDASGFSSRPDQSLREAAQLLEEAVDRDPTFLRAFCELAWVHDTLYINGDDHTPARAAMADKAIAKAAAIDPNAGEVYLAKGHHLYCTHLDYDAARRELNIATSLLPNEPRCFELAGFVERRAGGLGRFSKSIFKGFRSWDPRSIHLAHFPIANARAHAVVLRKKPKFSTRRLRSRLTISTHVWPAPTSDLEWRADPKPLHTAVEQALAKDPTVAAEIAEVWFYVAVCERDWQSAQRAMAAAPDRDVCRTENVAFPIGWCEGFIARAQGDSAAARKAFSGSRALNPKKLCANSPTSVKRLACPRD